MGEKPEKGKGKGWEVRDGRRELDLGGEQTQVQASNSQSIYLAIEVAMALPIICRWGNWVPGRGGPYWGYLQWWYSSRVWGLVLCWEHDRHYLNASSLSHCHYPTLQASNMPRVFWLLLVADLGSDYNRSHPWVYALNQDRAEGPYYSGRVSSLKASYREDNRSCCLLSANCVLDIVPFVCINLLDSLNNPMRLILLLSPFDC